MLLGGRVHPVMGRRVIYVACDLISGTARVADEDEIADVAWCDTGGSPRPCAFGLPRSRAGLSGRSAEELTATRCGPLATPGGALGDRGTDG